jgi:quercetin dioxygenase-like cupin family protein
MIKQTSRILAILFVIILLLPITGISQETTIAAHKVVKELAATTQSWDGELLPAYPQGQPKVTILRISVPAGARLDTHHHPVINAGVLISGQLTVVAEGGKTLVLNAGDPIVELVNTPHYGINQGKDPVDIIVFYAGTADTPITVTEQH